MIFIGDLKITTLNWAVFGFGGGRIYTVLVEKRPISA
jgi:hypothetical protein